MIRKLLIALLFLGAQCAFAFELSDIQRIYKKQDFSASYVQEKTLKAQNRVLKSSGTVIILKKKNVLIRQRVPFEQEMIITPNALFMLLEDEKTQITRESNPMVFEISNMILKLFTGSEDVKKYFDTTISGDPDGWKVSLTPKEDVLKKVFKFIELEGDTLLNKICIVDMSDDKTVMRYFDHTETIPNLSETEKTYLEP